MSKPNTNVPYHLGLQSQRVKMTAQSALAASRPQEFDWHNPSTFGHFSGLYIDDLLHDT